MNSEQMFAVVEKKATAVQGFHAPDGLLHSRNEDMHVRVYVIVTEEACRHASHTPRRLALGLCLVPWLRRRRRLQVARSFTGTVDADTPADKRRGRNKKANFGHLRLTKRLSKTTAPDRLLPTMISTMRNFRSNRTKKKRNRQRLLQLLKTRPRTPPRET